MSEIVSCGETDEERQRTFLRTVGMPAAEIRRIAESLPAAGVFSARLTIPGFQLVCQNWGHVVWQYLPGSICIGLRAKPGCLLAEVVRSPHLGDPAIVAEFQTAGEREAALAALPASRFHLEHFTFDCPPLTVARGSLEDLLGLAGA